MSNLPPLGCDVLVRGERAVLRHVVRVPRHTDLFGSPIRASYRAAVVFDDGSWLDSVPVGELAPITA